MIWDADLSTREVGIQTTGISFFLDAANQVPLPKAK